MSCALRITPSSRPCKHLGDLPDCGILAVSHSLGGNLATRVLGLVKGKPYLTVGDRWQTFTGMINLSQDQKVVKFNETKIKEAGLQVTFPSALIDEYNRIEVSVDARGR